MQSAGKTGTTSAGGRPTFGGQREQSWSHLQSTFDKRRRVLRNAVGQKGRPDINRLSFRIRDQREQTCCCPNVFWQLRFGRRENIEVYMQSFKNPDETSGVALPLLEARESTPDIGGVSRFWEARETNIHEPESVFDSWEHIKSILAEKKIWRYICTQSKKPDTTCVTIMLNLVGVHINAIIRKAKQDIMVCFWFLEAREEDATFDKSLVI